MSNAPVAHTGTLRRRGAPAVEFSFCARDTGAYAEHCFFAQLSASISYAVVVALSRTFSHLVIALGR